MDVQICSVMTGLHLNAQSFENTQTCVLRERWLVGIKQLGAGLLLFIPSICPCRTPPQLPLLSQVICKMGQSSS